MRISIIGTGYVGLVSGACLAEKGHQVACVDIDAEKVKRINQGFPPIFELGLEDLLKKNIGKNLVATIDLRDAVMNSEMTLIAVGTPFDGKAIDLRFVRTVAQQIGAVLKDKNGYHLVVVKSTVVPGTTDEVVLPELEKASGKKAGSDFGVGMNPEFLTEGEAISDFMFPDRIVLGGNDERAIDLLGEAYAAWPNVDTVRTNNKTAEMIKYASNAMLATLISFSNELANLGSALGGIDTVEVMQGLHLSRYLSPILPSGERIRPAINSFLMAGCGFGGSCLPKDVSALIAHGQNAGEKMELLQAVIDINARQPKQVQRLLGKHFSSLAGIRVAILGLSFRPDTDDMRESPAIPIIKDLLAAGAKVQAYDPVAKHEAEKIFKDTIIYSTSLHDVIQNVDVIILVTRWKEFLQVPELLKGLPKSSIIPVFIDGRRQLDKKSIAQYEGIGL